MSIDKSEEGGHKPPSSRYWLGVRRGLWAFALGPVFTLPFLLLAAITWGVCLRVAYELFMWAWDLFGF